MYERTKAHLELRISAQQTTIDQAEAGAQSARAGVDAAAGALTAAQNDAAGAQQTLDGLTTAVGTAEAAVGAAETHAEHAAQAVDDWAANEPDRPEPPEKPNPGWLLWNRKLQALERKAAAARGAVTDAQRAVDNAKAQRDQSAVALAAAQSRVADGQAALARAQGVQANAEQAVVAGQAVLQSLVEEGRRLDALAARILAEPLDRDDVNAAGDAELAAALAVRTSRQQLRYDRLGLVGRRAATLGAYDATADELAVVAASIRGLPDAAAYSGLVDVADGVDALAAASREQRARPAADRSDDLDAAAVVLADLLGLMQGIAIAATAECDACAAALAEDASELADLKAAAPKK